MDPGSDTHHNAGPAMQLQAWSDETWEAQRSVITRLYTTPKTTLQRVMETMEKDHGFKAT